MVEIKRKGNNAFVTIGILTKRVQRYSSNNVVSFIVYAMKKFLWNHKTVRVTSRFQYSAYQGRRDLNGNS